MKPDETAAMTQDFCQQINRNRSPWVEERSFKMTPKSDKFRDMEQKRLNHVEQIAAEDWGKGN